MTQLSMIRKLSCYCDSRSFDVRYVGV